MCKTKQSLNICIFYLTSIVSTSHNKGLIMWCMHKFVDLMYGRSWDMIKIWIKIPFLLTPFLRTYEPQHTWEKNVMRKGAPPMPGVIRYLSTWFRSTATQGFTLACKLKTYADRLIQIFKINKQASGFWMS